VAITIPLQVLEIALWSGLFIADVFLIKSGAESSRKTVVAAKELHAR
jgi:hypothetical protein